MCIVSGFNMSFLECQFDVINNENEDKTVFCQKNFVSKIPALSNASCKNVKKKTVPYNNFYIYDRANENLAVTSPAKFISKYLNKDVLNAAVKNNPVIFKILDEFSLEKKYVINNASSIIMSHLIPVAKTAKNIYFKSNTKKNDNDMNHLIQAALLHDIGKIFIPSEILNKKGKLTPKERRIVEQHNKLGFEILKTTDLSPKVAKLALEHHDYEKNILRTPLNQILTVADIYCALREKRPYKKSFGSVNAKAILYEMAVKGMFDIKYISYI